MKSQFNEAFSKIDGLKQWFDEQQFVISSKGGNNSPRYSHQGHCHSKTPSIHQPHPRITLHQPIHQTPPRIPTP